MRVALLIAGVVGMATHGDAVLAAVDPAPPVAITSDALARWVAAKIESSGWTVADVSSNEALLIQTGLKPPDAGGPARAYVRWERFPRSSPEHPWRSALQLLEINCGGGQFRELSWTAYTGSNFSGVMIENQPSAEGGWRTVAEGSIMLAAIARVCPGAVERKGAAAQGATGASIPPR